ncbi:MULTISPECIES: hypothetical protein [unclassified Nocardioides]|uniref:hypothetical protein n=1 Tax=unclassified Nocardioides TaxID=2615069 RepID=UPI00360E05F2
MLIPLVPDPRELSRAAQRATQFVDDLVGLVPRAAALLASAEALVERAHHLVDRIEETRSAAATVVTRTDETRARADTVQERAAATVEDVDEAVRRATALLASLEPTLVRLQPTLERLAETTDPEEVDAIVGLVDSLGNVGPDVRELLDIASHLNDVLGRVPGMSRLRKRVEENGRDVPQPS